MQTKVIFNPQVDYLKVKDPIKIWNRTVGHAFSAADKFGGNL